MDFWTWFTALGSGQPLNVVNAAGLSAGASGDEVFSAGNQAISSTADAITSPISSFFSSAEPWVIVILALVGLFLVDQILKEV